MQLCREQRSVFKGYYALLEMSRKFGKIGQGTDIYFIRLTSLTSGKYPIALVKDGASRGTMLYGMSSPDIVALDFFILLNWNNKHDKSAQGELFLIDILHQEFLVLSNSLSKENIEQKNHHMITGEC